MTTLGLKNVNMLSKEQYGSVVVPAIDELYAISGSGFGFPSNRYDDLELGASGTNYIAPANGYFVLDCPGSSSPFGIWAGCNSDDNLVWFDGRANTAGSIQWTSPPCKKGGVMTLFWSNLNTANIAMFRFIYAEGE